MKPCVWIAMLLATALGAPVISRAQDAADEGRKIAEPARAKNPAKNERAKQEGTLEPAKEGAEPSNDPPPVKHPNGEPAPGSNPTVITPAPVTTANPRPVRQPARVELEIGQGDELWGRLTIELEDTKSPISSRNFLRYVDEGFYNRTIFHRVLAGPQNNKIVQGGGYTAIDAPKKAPHSAIICESRNGLKNLRGTIAVARGSAAMSGTSQFYINLEDNPGLDFPSTDGWGYAVFGKIVSGMELLDRFKSIELTDHRLAPPDKPERSQPVNPPFIRTAQRVPSAEAAPVDPNTERADRLKRMKEERERREREAEARRKAEASEKNNGEGEGDEKTGEEEPPKTP